MGGNFEFQRAANSATGPIKRRKNAVTCMLDEHPSVFLHQGSSAFAGTDCPERRGAVGSMTRYSEKTFGDLIEIKHGFAFEGQFLGASSMPEPRVNLGGDPYLTDGLRLVLFLGTPRRSFDQIEFLDWERPRP